MRIYAHRGASGDFPEGSMAAYWAAIEQGADGFECDVRLTKDKQIICYHDKDAKRLANLDLEIAKSTFSQLKKSINPFRLDELLDLAILNKKDLVIEFKHQFQQEVRSKNRCINYWLAKGMKSQTVELKYFSSHFPTLPYYVIKKVLIAVDS